MNFTRLSTKLAAMAALGITFVSGSALAQTVTDSDQVEVRAQVLGGINVVAVNSPLDLGVLAGGASGTINANGVGSTVPVSAARFDIFTFQPVPAGPFNAWILSVAYAPLNGPAPFSPITIAAPATPPICFSDAVGVQAGCTGYASGDAVPGDDNEGTAWVGFRFVVPAAPTPGNYSNAAAIVLTAETTLN